MTYLTDIMSKRSNTHHLTDQIPDKKIIDEILSDAYKLTPFKNNSIHFRINVFGPEYKKEKRNLAITSPCEGDWSKWKHDKNKMKELESIYEKFILNPKSNPIFNTQLLAPYLLVYYQTTNIKTKSQLNSEFYKFKREEDLKRDSSADIDDNIYTRVTENIKNYNWIIQSAMHGITTAYLCAEKDLNASFCQCYFYSDHHPNFEIIKNKINNWPRQIAFILGIGYKDNRYIPSGADGFKPLLEEIIEWK